MLFSNKLDSSTGRSVRHSTNEVSCGQYLWLLTRICGSFVYLYITNISELVFIKFSFGTSPAGFLKIASSSSQSFSWPYCSEFWDYISCSINYEKGFKLPIIFSNKFSTGYYFGYSSSSVEQWSSKVWLTSSSLTLSVRRWFTGKPSNSYFKFCEADWIGLSSTVNLFACKDSCY